MSTWTTYLAVQAGASASLLGLVLVALSVSFATIIGSPHLPNRALEGLAVLVLNMLAAMVLLIPGQGEALQGGEVLGVVVLAWALISALHRHSLRSVEREHRRHAVLDTVLGQTVLLLWGAASVLLCLGSAVGMGTAAAAFMLGYVFVLFQVWILLVEIHR